MVQFPADAILGAATSTYQIEEDSLKPLPRLHQTPFPFFEHPPTGPVKKEACILLHGLGENRCGIHYFHRDLARDLSALGYAVFRFDLAGCGDSTDLLSIERWKWQVEKLSEHASYFEKIHFISRGLSSLLLPLQTKSKAVAIHPPSPSFIAAQIDQMPLEPSDSCWIPRSIPSLSLQQKKFWISLGVEPSCMGGLILPYTFLKEMKHFLVEWKGRTLDIPSLFINQSERNEVISKICEIIQE